MKKVLSIFMTLLLCVSLVGCGEKENEDVKYTPENVKTLLEDEGYKIEYIEDDFSDFIFISDEETIRVLSLFLSDGDVYAILYGNKDINSGNYIHGLFGDDEEVELSKLEKEYQDEQKEDYEKWLKSMKLTEEEIIDFGEWYYIENADESLDDSLDDPTEEQSDTNITLGQKNALQKAKSYLSLNSGFSYQGLKDQLYYEQFTDEEVTYAVDNCGANWNEQAALKAQSYMEFDGFSRQSLIDQLLYEGFTKEQAEYGVSSVGY